MLVQLYCICTRDSVLWGIRIASRVDLQMQQNVYLVEPLLPITYAEAFIASQPTSIVRSPESIHEFPWPVTFQQRLRLLPPKTDQYYPVNETFDEDITPIVDMLRGKYLLSDELEWTRTHSGYSQEQWNKFIQTAVNQRSLQLLPAIRLRVSFRNFWSWKPRFQFSCNRCGAGHEWLVQSDCHKCGPHCISCQRCVEMGRAKTCGILFHAPSEGLAMHPSEDERVSTDFGQAVSHWNLSPKQQRVARKLINFLSFKQTNTYLVWAVTGAGKTEMIFPLLQAALDRQLTCAIVTPRKDVVMELAPRIQRAFSNISVVALYGGSEDTIHSEASITVSTIHQLFRFASRFGLMIIDEMDAFPYHNNPALEYVAQKALIPGGKTVWLTATPPKRLQQQIRRGEIPHTILASRFHGHPLPVPKYVRIPSLSYQLSTKKVSAKLQSAILKSLERGAQQFIFVPNIAKGENMLKLLILKCKLAEVETASTSAKDVNREQKILKFRKGEIKTLITTTILERGITVAKADVMVLDADQAPFDETALVQMSGRAGRSKEDPAGEVFFFASHYTKPLRDAIHQIKYMNHLVNFGEDL